MGPYRPQHPPLGCILFHCSSPQGPQSATARQNRTWHGDCTRNRPGRLEACDINYSEGGNQMPGRDGTGPAGNGPMTGKGSGSCILSIPDNLNEAIRGFAGNAGRPVEAGGTKEKGWGQFAMARGGGAGSAGGRGRGTAGMRGFGAGQGSAGSAGGRGKGGRGTGRRNGFCTAGRRPMGPGFARGARQAVGPGTDVPPEAQVEILQSQARRMEEALEAIKARIREAKSEMPGNRPA